MMTITLHGETVVNLEPDSVTCLKIIDAEKTVINISGTEIVVLEEYKSLSKRIEEDRGYEVEILIPGELLETDDLIKAPEPVELKPEFEEPDPSFNGDTI